MYYCSNTYSVATVPAVAILALRDMKIKVK